MPPLVRAIAGVLVVAIAGFVLARSGAGGGGHRTTSTAIVHSAPSTNAGYALSLNTVIARLNAVRRTDGPLLSHGTAHVRAQAAAALAVAHRQAAVSTQGLAAGPAASANTALVQALSATASAYTTLGRALAADRTTAYRAAQSRLQAASTALGVAYARLRALGYRIG